MLKTVRTPCIGVCSTGIGDSVCRGCKRFEHEVIHWNAYTPQQKLSIDRRLSQMISEVIQHYLCLDSPDLLQRQLRMQQIRYAEWRDPNCWLYELLKAGASQIDDPASYGFSVRRSCPVKGLPAIKDLLEDEIYALSIAHFERFIVANTRKAVTVST